MKNIKRLVILFLLLPILSIAQEKKINFTHKLVYEGDKTMRKSDININIYISPDGSVLETEEEHRLLKNNIIIPISTYLDGLAHFTNSYSKIDSIPSFTLVKIDKKDKINGISCNYYDFLMEKKNNEKIKMCISENNSIDMFATLPIKNKNIKGLIVKISTEKDAQGLELKSIEKIKSSISIDWNTTWASIKNQLNKLKKYKYEDSTEVEPIKVIKAPVIAVDSSKAYSGEIPPIAPPINDKNNISIRNYNSKYKIKNTRGISLAIDRLTDNSPYWKGLPLYCKELDQKVSVFKNISLREHARDYAGQLCDMYLSQIKEYSVDVKGTLDQIRYDENYFINTIFNKEDREILSKFLKDLD